MSDWREIAKCKHASERRWVKLEDKGTSGKSATFDNKNEVTVTRHAVDNCEDVSGKKCDYILSTSKCQHFVELKGTDYRSATKQLALTVNQFADHNLIIRVYAFTSKAPSGGQRMQQKKREFKRLLSKGKKSKCDIQFVSSNKKPPVE